MGMTFFAGCLVVGYRRKRGFVFRAMCKRSDYGERTKAAAVEEEKKEEPAEESDEDMGFSLFD